MKPATRQNEKSALRQACETSGFRIACAARLLLLLLLLPAAMEGQSPSGMALIPAGSFTMGNCMDPNEGWSDELPLHTVYVSAVYMDKYDVTKSLWDSVYQWAITHGYSFDYAGSGKAANHPVQTIDWYDCVKWSNARSEKEGLSPCYYTDASQTIIYRSGTNNLSNACVNWAANGYRLPTEAEWEKAARGGASGHRFPWSDADTINQSRANYYSSWYNGVPYYPYDVNSTIGYHPTFATGGYPYTSPVDYFAPNGYGLYDMAGNVWQWCWDWLDGNWYSNTGATQNDTHGPASSPWGFRVLRGGSCGSVAHDTRCAYRHIDYSSDPNSALIGFGFRCVRISLQTSPVIISHPANQIVQVGSNVTFNAVVDGQPTLNYQWCFNGSPISGATNATLTLNSVGAGNSGGYSVIVWNAYGSVTSATASLAVLTDGANGNKPVQIIAQPIPSKPSGAKNLVFVTHGWQWVLLNPTGPPPQPWMVEMTNDIVRYLVASGQSSDWQVEAYYWLSDAWTLLPDTALNNAQNHGKQLGKQFATNGYQRVHLIAHSAGSELIQAIANQLKASPNPPVIQMTFLDPFIGLFGEDQNYGTNAGWSDCYFVEDVTGASTGGNLTNAFNVDVSWVDPAHTQAPFISPSGGKVALSSHGYPIDFYIQSITNTDPNWCAAGYGFALSQEIEGASWTNNQANDSVGSGPLLPCSPPDAVKNPNPNIADMEPWITGTPVVISDAAHALSDFGSSLAGDAGFLLNSIRSSLPLVQSGGVRPMGGPVSTNTPAWLALGVTVTNAVNFVQFDAGFTDTNAAQGLLTVYWNTNQVGMVDERVANTNLQTYRFTLPNIVSSGLYTLSFRLDSFDNSSSIAVTNVATGFVGVTNPITLGISFTNSRPMLQLTAATNFNYLVQSSTNLVDWTPTALLLNTNGTAQFIDSAVTNFGARFYRVTMP